MPPLENMAISVLVPSHPFALFLGPLGPYFFTLFSESYSGVFMAICSSKSHKSA